MGATYDFTHFEGRVLFEETSKDVVRDVVEATKGWLRVVEADGGDVVGGGTKISGVAVLTFPIREDAKRALHLSLVNKRDVGHSTAQNIKNGNNIFKAFD